MRANLVQEHEAGTRVDGPPLHVALVHPYSWPEVRRGAERYMDDLATYLAGRGHRVEVITGTHGRARVERPADGVVVRYRKHVMSARAGSRFAASTARRGLSEVETFGLPAMASLLRHRYDVVHALAPACALAGTLARRPTLFTVTTHLQPEWDQIPSRRAPRLVLSRAVRRATAVAALTEASARVVEEHFGRPSIVLSPGIRLERFSANLSPRVGPPRILFSGSLSDQRKRADLAVEAFALVLERFPDARLALSGDGDPRWISALGNGRLGRRVQEAIDILGPGNVDDVPARYRQATVTILPAEHEAFGLVLVESLACGTPVVCLDSGGMPEIVDDPRIGRVAATASPSALANAIVDTVELAADPLTPEHCVAHARRWSWNETIGPAHERAYRQLSVPQTARTVSRSVTATATVRP